MLLLPHPVTLSISVLCSAAILSGGTVSRAAFYENPRAASSYELCQALRGSEAAEDPSFQSGIRYEMARRNLGESSCDAIVSERHLAAGAIALVGVALIAAAAKSNGNEAGYGSDYNWAWDLQANGHGGRSWVCRGIQSGRYSDQSHCAYMAQVDSTWPGN
jgi:hypothetical protein